LYDRKYSCTEKDMDCNGDFNYGDIDYFSCLFFGNDNDEDGDLDYNTRTGDSTDCPGDPDCIDCITASNNCAPPCTD
ncbi:MAG: hypothetical protein AABX08_03375, partial [Nanoarchaeota archaeon]